MLDVLSNAAVVVELRVLRDCIQALADAARSHAHDIQRLLRCQVDLSCGQSRLRVLARLGLNVSHAVDLDTASLLRLLKAYVNYLICCTK